MEIDSAARKTIEDILTQRTRVAAMSDSIKESIKALAERLDVKPAQITKVITLVEKEREKGDVIEGERNTLETAESFLIG